MAHVFNVPHKTMVTYDRFLKEGGLLTTGARGVNAPNMTPMDAARVTIALLSTDSPGQAVERVKRFGSLPYSPDFSKIWPWYENIGEVAFRQTFEGETLEEVLAFLFHRVEALGVQDAAVWFDQNNFSLRITDFYVLAELVSWKMQDGKPVGEIVVPFRGDPMAPPKSERITGQIRTTRETVAMQFFEVGFQLSSHANPYPGFDSNGRPIWGRE